MSTVSRPMTRKQQIAWTRKRAGTIIPMIPPEPKQLFPALAVPGPTLALDDAVASKFVEAVEQLQMYLRIPPEEVDGLYWEYTHQQVLRQLMPHKPSSQDEHWMYRGVRYSRDESKPEYFFGQDFTLVGMDHKQALRLDREANRTEIPNRDINFIVLHWGGKTALNLRNYFNTVSTSSHGCADGANGYQFIDFAHATHHAGSKKVSGMKNPLSLNRTSVGYDVAQSPLVDDLRFYDNNVIKAVANTEYRKAGRGLRQMLSLHPKTAKTMAMMVVETAKLLNIELRAPRDSQNALDYRLLTDDDLVEVVHGATGAPTLVSHFHLSPTKPDIIGWYEDVCDEIFK